MRNLLAIALGIAAFFLVSALVTFSLLALNIGSVSQFARGNIAPGNWFAVGQQAVLVLALVVFPIASLVTGFLGGICARSREYVVGLVSVLPVLVLYYHFWVYYLILVLGVLISTSIGVTIAIRLKGRRMSATAHTS